MLRGMGWKAIGGFLVASLLAGNLQAETRFSEIGGGQQVWIKGGDFASRSQNNTPGVFDFVIDPDAAGPLSGAAYYFKGDGDADVEFPWLGGAVSEWLDWWAEYQLLPTDLPVNFNLSGTWYFWARVQIPVAPSSTEYNVDSDWLIVNGDSGDIDLASPTNADWFNAVQANERATDRIVNDVHAGGGDRPNWVWIGYQGTERRPKNFKLINDKITFRIFKAEAGHWNARIDVICWSNTQSYVPTDADFLGSIQLGDCPAQHITTGVNPTSVSEDSNASLTITGTDLNLVSEVRLEPAGGGTAIVGTNLTLNPTNTELTADFATAGKPYGLYNVVTVQGGSCSNKTLLNAFEILCATPTVFSTVTPDTLANPTGQVQLRITGTNVTLLTGVALKYANEDDPNAPLLQGTALTPDGDSLLALFDFTCVPAGPYHLQGTRENCPNPVRVENAVWVTKPPPGSKACNWQPWAASWSAVLQGNDLLPDDLNNAAYNPPNWDYTMSQPTVLNTPKDTPDGSAAALHLFWDQQPPETGQVGGGSGGVYQEIQVTPGVPLEYSFWWKAAGAGDSAKWFEFLLLDGPFNLYYADGFQEQNRQMNNPYMVRKKDLTGDNGFGWTEVTHLDPADPGGFGPRPQTLTPTRNVVTVVLKAGSCCNGRVEAFFDNVVVTQNGGPNLLVNADFESGGQKPICDGEWMFKDPCESDFWRRSPFTPIPCPDPFADADEDGDVDQVDFGLFQACLTHPQFGPVLAGCECFDRPEPNMPDGNIDQVDYAAFVNCAMTSGPAIPVDPTCDD